MRHDCCNIVRYSDCLYCSCGAPIWEKIQSRVLLPIGSGLSVILFWKITYTVDALTGTHADISLTAEKRDGWTDG